MTLGICAVFRNEAPYLREWIEFHRLVGIERFYLYENRSDDDWFPVLLPYVRAGIVQLTDWPFQPPCHLQAYDHFLRLGRREVEWGAFIDCDEFLFPTSKETVAEALAQFPVQGRGAVGVNWLCFGSSGHEVASAEP